MSSDKMSCLSHYTHTHAHTHTSWRTLIIAASPRGTWTHTFDFLPKLHTCTTCREWLRGQQCPRFACPLSQPQACLFRGESRSILTPYGIGLWIDSCFLVPLATIPQTLFIIYQHSYIRHHREMKQFLRNLWSLRSSQSSLKLPSRASPQ